jgi:hypothetical protein
LTAKPPVRRAWSRVRLVLARETSSEGGWADSEMTELTVQPRGPSGLCVVMMLTPLGRWVMAAQKVSRSARRPCRARLSEARGRDVSVGAGRPMG